MDLPAAAPSIAHWSAVKTDLPPRSRLPATKTFSTDERKVESTFGDLVCGLMSKPRSRAISFSEIQLPVKTNDRVRKGDVPASQELVAAVLAAQDHMRALIETPHGDHEDRSSTLLSSLHAAVNGSAAAPTAASPAPTTTAPVEQDGGDRHAGDRRATRR